MNRTGLLALCAAALLAGAGVGQDYVYSTGGEIHEGRIVELTGDGGIVFENEAGERVTFRASEVVAHERRSKSADVFVVTEKAPDKLEAASRRFAVTAGDQEKKGAGGGEESPGDPAAYRRALVAYERALICLQRLVELYPQRAAEMEPSLQALRSGRAMVSKLCGAGPEEAEAPDAPDGAGESDPEGGVDEEREHVPLPPGDTGKGFDPRPQDGSSGH